MAEALELSRDDALQWARMSLSNLTTVDGLWFIELEDRYGIDVALEIDTIVWKRYGAVEARRIREKMKVGDGLDGLMKALRLSAFFNAEGVGYELVRKDEDSLLCTVTDCRAQKARLRSGRAEFPCRGVSLAFFEGFLKAFGPDIRTECLGCPPDEHTDDMWCRWLFTTKRGP